jgi:hypothetical protein
LPHVAHLPVRRREGGRTRVTILIHNAYGMGGTMRTVYNLAGCLSEQYDVEVLSVIRRKREPFFAPAPGVKLTALDDTVVPGGLGRRQPAQHRVGGSETALERGLEGSGHRGTIPAKLRARASGGSAPVG